MTCPSRIAVRLLAFNLLLLFLPVAGILSLDVYETRLLDAQERSMVQQARVLAAALSEHQTIEPGPANALIGRLGQRGDARLRIYDAGGLVVADSNRLQLAGPPASSDAASYAPPTKSIRVRMLYRFGAWLAAARRALMTWTARLVAPGRAVPGPASGDIGIPPEVAAALAGRYGSTVRPTPGQRSLTLNSAVPVLRGHAVIGAVLVSQTTFRVLQALYAVRLRIFEVVVASIVAASVLTAMAAGTVVRPLARLRREASDLADRRSRLPGRFHDTSRHDEIGDVARSLEQLTRRLHDHIRSVEQFASDVSHEFRNPLASIRSAAEMAAQTGSDEERLRFLDMLTRDVDRLERLVSSVRELARIDTQLEQEPLGTIDVGGLLLQVAQGLQLARPEHPGIAVRVASGGAPATVRASADRLAQVIENVLANARSFAPAGTVVDAEVTTDAGHCHVVITDRGPGIPPAHLDRAFDRFFTYRPAQTEDRRQSHTGLGLAIARTIVEGFRGTITAANGPDGGARFDIRLPLSRD